MRLVLNVLWLVLAGFWMFLGYLGAAALWCLTIIGIPFGIASFRIGLFALWPFGRTVVTKPTAGLGSAIGNVIWFVFFGLWLALGHLVTGALLCLTVIGIPLGLANFKLIPVALLPLGRDIVPVDGTAGFGQPGFGQPGFGQSGFGQSGFGQSGSGPASVPARPS